MIRTIAVPLFSVAEAEWLAPAISEFARVLDAHLIGVHASQSPLVHPGMGGEMLIYVDLLKWHQQEEREVRSLWEAAAERAGVPAEFRAATGGSLSPEDFLISSLRGADLVVMAAAGMADAALRHQVVRQSGRPVLVVPPGAQLPAAPRRIVIGWSNTREATRAAHDALAFVTPETQIDLITVHRGRKEPRAIMDGRADFAAAAHRLGFSANLVDHTGGIGDTAEVLLSAARDRGADMIVTGAFGHSQVYDFVLGAVTSHLMEHADLPVLLSK